MSYISECSPQKCFASPWKYLLVVLVCSSSTYFAYDPQFPDLGQRAKIPVSMRQFIIDMQVYLVVLNCFFFFFRKIYLMWNTSFLSLDIQVLFLPGLEEVVLFL